MKTLVVYDLGNLFFCSKKRFGEGRINYGKVQALIGEAAKSVGYTPHDSKTFRDALKFLGIDVIIQAGDPTVRIACDTLEIASQFDKIVLCTSRREAAPLISKIKSKGVRVEVLACGVPTDLIKVADSFQELPEDSVSKALVQGDTQDETITTTSET